MLFKTLLTNIEDGMMCSRARAKLVNARETSKNSRCHQSHLNRPQARPKIPECRAPKDQHCNDGRICKASNWKITDSTLFAYNAMLGCSHGEKTDLYAWLKGHHRNCGPQSDCSLLLGKLEAQGLNSSNTEGDNHGNGRVFSVPRPSYEATTRWGDDESRLHGAARPTLRGESEENSAARYTQADCSFSGYYNGGDIRKDLQGGSIQPTAASVKDEVDSTDAYVSDGEDSGRISPDTYRLWTTNCSKGQKNSRQSTEDCAVCHAQTAGLHTAHEQVDLIPDDTTTASCPSISSGESNNNGQKSKPLIK